MNLYLTLLHYPVYNKNKEIIVTSIVTHDIHDISRASVTYGVRAFYLVQPFEGERAIAERIVRFWKTSGKDYNSNRLEAVSTLSIKESFEQVIDEITFKNGAAPIIIGTSAQEKDTDKIDFMSAASLLVHGKTVLLVFGTGWGIADVALEKINYFLPPICGIGEFNHLSVRSAVAIVLDRIINNYKELMSLHT